MNIKRTLSQIFLCTTLVLFSVGVSTAQATGNQTCAADYTCDYGTATGEWGSCGCVTEPPDPECTTIPASSGITKVKKWYTAADNVTSCKTLALPEDDCYIADWESGCLGWWGDYDPQLCFHCQWRCPYNNAAKTTCIDPIQSCAVDFTCQNGETATGTWGSCSCPVTYTCEDDYTGCDDDENILGVWGSCSCEKKTCETDYTCEHGTATGEWGCCGCAEKQAEQSCNTTTEPATYSVDIGFVSSGTACPSVHPTKPECTVSGGSAARGCDRVSTLFPCTCSYGGQNCTKTEINCTTPTQSCAVDFACQNGETASGSWGACSCPLTEACGYTQTCADDYTECRNDENATGGWGNCTCEKKSCEARGFDCGDMPQNPETCACEKRTCTAQGLYCNQNQVQNPETCGCREKTCAEREITCGVNQVQDPATCNCVSKGMVTVTKNYTRDMYDFSYIIEITNTTTTWYLHDLLFQDVWSNGILQGNINRNVGTYSWEYPQENFFTPKNVFTGAPISNLPPGEVLTITYVLKADDIYGYGSLKCDGKICQNITKVTGYNPIGNPETCDCGSQQFSCSASHTSVGGYPSCQCLCTISCAYGRASGCTCNPPPTPACNKTCGENQTLVNGGSEDCYCEETTTTGNTTGVTTGVTEEVCEAGDCRRVCSDTCFGYALQTPEPECACTCANVTCPSGLIKDPNNAGCCVSLPSCKDENARGTVFGCRCKSGYTSVAGTSGHSLECQPELDCGETGYDYQGTCKCLWGYNGTYPNCEKITTEDCTDGKIANAHGNCVCPEGEKVSSNGCVTDPNYNIDCVATKGENYKKTCDAWGCGCECDQSKLGSCEYGYFIGECRCATKDEFSSIDCSDPVGQCQCRYPNGDIVNRPCIEVCG